MLNDSDILIRVRSAASSKVLYLPHAVRQMLRPERMISIEEVQNVIFEGSDRELSQRSARAQLFDAWFWI